MMFASVFMVMTSAMIPLASAHCLISSATGNLGGKGQGLGVVSGGLNALTDVTVFKSGTFGATAAGPIVPATGLAAMIKITGATIPQISKADGTVTMALHQINADGAGPMSCSVSADASGKEFAAMDITTNVPGTKGRSSAAKEDFPLVAKMPAGVTCTGTVGASKNVCLVKCANPAGPFGGIVPVQMG